MKVCFFHLMPYRFLPDCFVEDHRSVWVDVSSSLYDARKAHGLYHEYLDELAHAERCGFEGLCVNEHYQNAYGLMPSPNIWPRPLQEPHPPVWIPGGGSLETWDWAARRDYVYCYLSYSGYKRGKQTMDGFWDALAALGVDDNPYRAGFLQVVCVADTDAEAERLYLPHVDYFYQRCLHVWEGFAEAPGYRTVKTLRAGIRPQVGDVAKKIRESLDWKAYVEQGYIVAGSPSTVRQQLTECVRKLRVGHLMVLLQIGSMPKELVLWNTELFGKEVLPHLRGLWSEYQDRWWPRAAAEHGA